MYGNNENSNGNSYATSNSNPVASTSTYKDTLHISPHIAAHKSSSSSSSLTPISSSTSLVSCSSPSTLVNLSALPVSSTLLAPIVSTLDGLTYKLITRSPSHGGADSASQEMSQAFATTRFAPQAYGAPYRKEVTSPGGQSSSTIISSSGVRTTLTNLARAIPEDLSATSSDNKMSAHSSSAASVPGVVMSTQYNICSASVTGSNKPLPHIYTVAGQVPHSMFTGLLDRSGTYFRTQDSPNLNGQPQAILVSGLVACGDGSLEHAGGNNNTTLAALPPTTIVGELVGILNEPGIKKEHDIIREARPTLLQQQQQHIIQQPQQQFGGGGTTQQQQRERDLVRQALQAVVDGTGPKTSDQELIEYNYSAGDIQDLLMLNISSSGNLQQTVRQAGNHHPHGVAVAGGNTMTGLNVIDATTGAHVIMMQPVGAAAASGQLTSVELSALGDGTHQHQHVVASGGMHHHNQHHQQQHQHHHHQQLIQVTGAIMGTHGSAAGGGGGGGGLGGDVVISNGGTLLETIGGGANGVGGTTTIVCCRANSSSAGNENIAAVVNHNNNNSNGASSSSKGGKKVKYIRLSEEEQMQKRLRLAELMRKKRANETEEQKARRRIREAERMRKRRSMESEDQKAVRRMEAAERARLRRASLSLEQRMLDRRKAAERMRLRRLHEGEQQKILRRMRAAERMRRRRAEETEDQRAARRQSLALRMKNRRRRKQEELGRTSAASSSSCSLLHDDSMRSSLDDMGSLDDVKAQDLSGAVAASPGDDVLHDSLLGSDHFGMMQEADEGEPHPGQQQAEEKYSVHQQQQHHLQGHSSGGPNTNHRDVRMLFLSEHHHSPSSGMDGAAMSDADAFTETKQEMAMVALEEGGEGENGIITGDTYTVTPGDIIYSSDTRLKGLLRTTDKQDTEPLALQKTNLPTHFLQQHGRNTLSPSQKQNSHAVTSTSSQHSRDNLVTSIPSSSSFLSSQSTDMSIHRPSSSSTSTSTAATIYHHTSNNDAVSSSCTSTNNSSGGGYYTISNVSSAGGHYTQLVSAPSPGQVRSGHAHARVLHSAPSQESLGLSTGTVVFSSGSTVYSHGGSGYTTLPSSTTYLMTPSTTSNAGNVTANHHVISSGDGDSRGQGRQSDGSRNGAIRNISNVELLVPSTNNFSDGDTNHIRHVSTAYVPAPTSGGHTSVTPHNNSTVVTSANNGDAANRNVSSDSRIVANNLVVGSSSGSSNNNDGHLMHSNSNNISILNTNPSLGSNGSFNATSSGSIIISGHAPMTSSSNNITNTNNNNGVVAIVTSRSNATSNNSSSNSSPMSVLTTAANSFINTTSSSIINQAASSVINTTGPTTIVLNHSLPLTNNHKVLNSSNSSMNSSYSERS